MFFLSEPYTVHFLTYSEMFFILLLILTQNRCRLKKQENDMFYLLHERPGAVCYGFD
jgi:hypothetical protein